MKALGSHLHESMTQGLEARAEPVSRASKDIAGFDVLAQRGLAPRTPSVGPNAVTNVSRVESNDASWAFGSLVTASRPTLECLRPAAVPTAQEHQPLFDGVFLGGFECSCHRLADGRRLDLTRSSRHDEFANADYAGLRQIGMTACRDGISWIRAERVSGHFDFSFCLPLLRSARRQNITVVWDLMHFGWPNHIDVFSPAFPSRFARYAGTFARFLHNETDAPAMMAPINEMSYLAWAGGDVRTMNPFESARGVELKVQLVRATIEAIEAIRRVLPRARFLQPEPVINIVPHPEHPRTWRRVEADNLLQYQAWEMLCGNVWPSLGGNPRYLDIIGVNFYSDNQFMLDGTTILRGDSRYRPFSDMLLDVWHRYQRPMIVSETGHEGDARASWLRYVSDECVMAMNEGCELHGVTLYPILSTLGWGDDRRCDNGLWGDADESGHRPLCVELAREIEHQTTRLSAARTTLFQAKAQPKASGCP